MKNRSKNIDMFLSAFRIVSILLVIEGVFMLLSIIPSCLEIISANNQTIISNETKAIKILSLCAVITIVSGLLLYFFIRKKTLNIDKRSGFLVVTLVWIVFSLFGCLPYIFGGYIGSFTDAYFETMSGFTTTGASIMQDVETLPYSIGFWRILTEWIGGIGIIVILLSIVPAMGGGGGMALYSAEVAGPVKNKLSPHIRETSHILLSVYLCLTIIYIFSYHFGGMSWFDAVSYGLTTVATGGLASHNASAMDFAPHLQYMMIFFMTLSGTNLLFLYFMVKRKFKELRKSEEFKTYLGIILLATLLIFFLTFSMDKGAERTFREALFEVVASITSTGLVICDYTQWQTGAMVILFILMFSGAMSGSTTGGFKLVRTIILFKSVKTNITSSLHSNAFVPVTLDKKPVADETLFNIFAMFVLYILTGCVGLFVLVFGGVDFEQAGVSVISALSNMGPGYKESAAGNFAHFSPLAKWTMSVLMCVGRLELVTVYSLFTKSFWKR
ncbi:MAG: TrkH family potassium uptake protein [Bacteroidota bacterium]|nr:TrkH family potassium uptake protein [Bacteroidota bacterium]